MLGRLLTGLTCLGVLFTGGCQASDHGLDASGPYQAPGQGPDNGIVNENVAHATDWTYESYSGCFPGAPVPIVLRSMELLSPIGEVRIVSTGLKVDEGRLRAGVMPGALPAGYGRLRVITQVEANRMRCDGGDLVAQVAIAVSAPGHWEAKGVRLNYEAGGKPYIVDWRVRLVHCAPRNDTSKVCPTPGS